MKLIATSLKYFFYTEIGLAILTNETKTLFYMENIMDNQWRTQKFVKGGFGTEKTIALSGPGNGQKLQKLGLHSKTKCYAFKNILQ